MGTDFSLRPAPMEGQGAYNRNSRVQQAGASPAMPLWQKAAAQVVLPPASEAIVIADYGSSQGHSSFGPMEAAIHAIRLRTGQDRPISIVHNDLPGSAVHGARQRSRQLCPAGSGDLRIGRRPQLL